MTDRTPQKITLTIKTVDGRTISRTLLREDRFSHDYIDAGFNLRVDGDTGEIKSQRSDITVLSCNLEGA